RIHRAFTCWSIAADRKRPEYPDERSCFSDGGDRRRRTDSDRSRAPCSLRTAAASFPSGAVDRPLLVHGGAELGAGLCDRRDHCPPGRARARPDASPHALAACSSGDLFPSPARSLHLLVSSLAASFAAAMARPRGPSFDGGRRLAVRLA